MEVNGSMFILCDEIYEEFISKYIIYCVLLC